MKWYKLQHERQDNEAFRRKDLDDLGVGKGFPKQNTVSTITEKKEYISQSYKQIHQKYYLENEKTGRRNSQYM